MGFSYHSFDKGTVPPIEYNSAKTGEAYVVGEALKLTGDGLTKCGATETPTHICVGPKLADGTVPATRVAKDIQYAAKLTAAGAALKVGDKVTISADGLGVTATTTSGVAEIVRFFGGKAEGDAVGLRFAV